MSFRPHVLGIDDGPFDKAVDRDVPIVGVMMEGADLVEAVAVGAFPLDGDGPAEFLAEWILGLRFASTLHTIVFGGITFVVDVLSGVRCAAFGSLAPPAGSGAATMNMTG